MSCSLCSAEKNAAHIVLAVERGTRCVVGWAVTTERMQTAPQLQPVIDQVPNAFQYCTDDFSAYHNLNYHRGFYLVVPGKSQTFAVEGENAELRRYLARRSRCFSKCLTDLCAGVKLFVDCWNRRQLQHRRYLRYSVSLSDFISVPV